MPQGHCTLPADDAGRVLDRLAGLEQVIRPADIQQALTATGRVNSRSCTLTHEIVLWVVLAMGLLTDLPIRQVFKHARRFRKGEESPHRSSLCVARQRLGVAPVRYLFTQVARPLAEPETPGAFYRGWRLMGVDGTVFDGQRATYGISRPDVAGQPRVAHDDVACSPDDGQRLGLSGRGGAGLARRRSMSGSTGSRAAARVLSMGCSSGTGATSLPGRARRPRAPRGLQVGTVGHPLGVTVRVRRAPPPVLRAAVYTWVACGRRNVLGAVARSDADVPESGALRRAGRVAVLAFPPYARAY